MANACSILLVEDSADDRFFITTVLKATSQTLKVQHAVSDGAEAIDYLAGQGKYADRQEYPLPDLILLDLNMPRMNGFDVLRWMRDHGCTCPVVVLSGSDLPEDLERARALGASHYECKRMGLESMKQVVRRLEQFAAERLV